MADSLSTTYTGRVVAVNERGLRLEGHDAWANVSKWAVGVVLPPRGATATVTLDAQGFIRACEIADVLSGVTNGQNGAPGPAQGLSGVSERETVITRLAVLRSAVQLAQGRADLTSADVLRVAEVFERWVYREASDHD
jgi:hypothetical protein